MRDPRLADLRAMGLQPVWLAVAEEIGVDAFLRLWRILDAHDLCQANGTTLRVPLRRYRTFQRHVRNSFIEALIAAGVPDQDIRKRVERQLGERISIRHIRRLTGRP